MKLSWWSWLLSSLCLTNSTIHDHWHVSHEKLVTDLDLLPSRALSESRRAWITWKQFRYRFQQQQLQISGTPWTICPQSSLYGLERLNVPCIQYLYVFFFLLGAFVIATDFNDISTTSGKVGLVSLRFHGDPSPSAISRYWGTLAVESVLTHGIFGPSGQKGSTRKEFHTQTHDPMNHTNLGEKKPIIFMVM